MGTDFFRKGMRALIPVLLSGLFMASGCAHRSAAESAEVAAARRLIREGRAECVVIRDGVSHPRRGHGVMPLLTVCEESPGLLRGATVVDKVIGRAAAAILISGGARAAHGETMSEDARVFLEKHGVAVSWGELVPRILNIGRSGLCPLERAVAGRDDPEEALAALRRRVAELRAASMRK